MFTLIPHRMLRNVLESLLRASRSAFCLDVGICMDHEDFGARIVKEEK